MYAIYDPAFKQPWLLATPVKLKPESVRAMYKDRLARVHATNINRFTFSTTITITRRAA